METRGISKENIREIYARGTEAYFNKNVRAAEEYFRKCLEIDPNYEDALEGLLITSLRNNLLTKAIDYLRELLDKTTELKYNFYLYLFSRIMLLPKDLRERANILTTLDMGYAFGSEMDIIIDYTVRGRFVAAVSKIDELKTVSEFRKSLLRMLLVMAQKRSNSYKETMKTLIKTDDILGLINFLNRMEAQHGLNDYETMIYDSAKIYFKIVNESYVPILVEGVEGKDDFIENAIKRNDFKRAQELLETLSLCRSDSIENILRTLLLMIQERLMLTSEDSIGTLYSSAIDNLESGKIDVAEDYFKKILKIAPEHKMSLFYLFTIEVEKGNFEVAVELFEKLFILNEQNRTMNLNFYLYLLSVIAKLPSSLSEAAIQLQLQDLYYPSQIAYLDPAIIEKCYNKRFKRVYEALKEMNIDLKNCKSIHFFRFLSSMIKTCNIAVKKNDLSDIKDLEEGNYSQLVNNIKKRRRQYPFSHNEDFLFKLALKLERIKSERIVFPVIEGNCETIFAALETNNFSKAHEIRLEEKENDMQKNALISAYIETLWRENEKVTMEPQNKVTLDESEQHYEDGLNFKAKKMFGNAEREFKIAIEINPNHYGANFEMFVEKVIEKEYEIAIEYLRKLYTLASKEQIKELNLYLFMLGYFLELPKDLKIVVVGLTEMDCRVDYLNSFEGNLLISIYQNIFRMNFIGAAKTVDNAYKIRESSKVIMLFSLLHECIKKRTTIKEKIRSLIEKGEYEVVLNFLHAIKATRVLSFEEESMIILLEDLFKIRTTGEIPVIKQSTRNGTMYSIRDRNYKKALAFNRTFRTSSKINDFSFEKLLEEIVSAIEEVEQNMANEGQVRPISSQSTNQPFVIKPIK